MRVLLVLWCCTPMLAHAAELAAQDSADPVALQRAVAPSLLPRGPSWPSCPGTPTGPGKSTIQLSMPSGYRIPPHLHPGFEHVVVKEGTLLVGMGDRLDVKKTLALTVGDSVTAPAGMHHYSVAKGRTVVSVTFNGPYAITYVHAEDAPRQRAFPFGY